MVAIPRAYKQAWQLLRGPLAAWFVPGALLTLLISAGGWWGISLAAEEMSDVLLAKWGGGDEGSWVHWITKWMLWVALLVVKVKLTKYIVLVVMGPLFAAVSEATERHFVGSKSAVSWGRWIKDAIRGLRSALVLAVVEWTATLACWGFGLTFPVLTPILLPLSWLIGAWAYGAASMDYVWEREGFGARKGLVSSLRAFGTALGIGVPFSLWMSVPLLAWTVGPMMGGMSAASAAWIALRQHGSSDGSGSIPVEISPQ